MPLTLSEVRPGLQVRVIANNMHGRQVNSENLLQAGDIITLNGMKHGQLVYYERGYFPRNNMLVSDLERLDAEPTPTIDIWQAARKYIRN